MKITDNMSKNEQFGGETSGVKRVRQRQQQHKQQEAMTNENTDDVHCADIDDDHNYSMPQSSANFDSLDDFFLVKLFSQLSVRDMLAVERVCKRWQTIILELVAKQGALGTSWTQEEENNCLRWRAEHRVTGGDIRDAIVMNNGWFYDFTDERSLTRLSYIFKKCPNVKCLHVNHAIISADCFKRIFAMNPHIECIHLRSNTLKGIGPCTEDNHQKSPHEWNRIGEVLGARIVHMSLNPHYEHRMNELDAQMFLKHFTRLVEFRIGTHFERDVSGKFVAFLPKTLKLFYSLGRELSKEALQSLTENHAQSVTHLTFFSHPLTSAEYFKSIGTAFTHLIHLRVNLSYNEIIQSTPSPISKLDALEEFSVDLNTFTDNNVDDGIIWCVKDGLRSLHTLEVTRACLSPRAFDSIQWCVPQLQKLILLSVEIQCFCKTEEVLERYERYCCAICRRKGWRSLANLKQLRELHVANPYYRQDKPKPFHSELCETLPEFKRLEVLHVFRYDISGCNLFEALDTLLNSRAVEGVCDDYLTLTLRSVHCDLESKKLNKKLKVNYDPWML